MGLGNHLCQGVNANFANIKSKLQSFEISFLDFLFWRPFKPCLGKLDPVLIILSQQMRWLIAKAWGCGGAWVLQCWGSWGTPSWCLGYQDHTWSYLWGIQGFTLSGRHVVLGIKFGSGVCKAYVLVPLKSSNPHIFVFILFHICSSKSLIWKINQTT